MDDDLVLRADDAGGVTTLTLNRATKLNALTPGVFESLRRHLDEIAKRDDVRCVVLAGAGKSFCAGHDLDAIASGERPPSPFFEPETIDALESLPQPTIARVHGHCLTGGLELALACDLLVGADSCSLGDTHGKWGLVPIWGMSVRLPERVGLSMAKELMFTSRHIDGREAQRIGLLDHCVPAAKLDGTVRALADEIAANSAGTNKIVKRLLRERFESMRTQALFIERRRPHGLPADMKERMNARPAKAASSLRQP